MANPPNGLMCGTGEYTTGYIHGKQTGSDKKVGVVALCLFDMQSKHRGAKVGKLKMVLSPALSLIWKVGTNGTKFKGIREHFKTKIAEVYKDIQVDFESFPGSWTNEIINERI